MQRHKIFKITALCFLYIVSFGTLVMVLWNWLMPTLFGLQTIHFAQALGLFALSRMLTGGFRFMSFGSSSNGGDSHHHWADKREMFENWKNKTAEEREKMKNDWKNNWRDRCRDRRPIGFHRSEPPQKDDEEPPPPPNKPSDFI